MPEMGLLDGYSLTNLRNLPTVISKRSNTNEFTVAGNSGSLLRLKFPPGTLVKAQQLSSCVGPHVAGNPTQLREEKHRPHAPTISTTAPQIPATTTLFIWYPHSLHSK